MKININGDLDDKMHHHISVIVATQVDLFAVSSLAQFINYFLR